MVGNGLPAANKLLIYKHHDPWTGEAKSTVVKTVPASVLGVPKLAVCSPLRIDLVRQQTEP